MSVRVLDYIDGWNEALVVIEDILASTGSDAVESLVSIIHELKIDRDEE